MPLLAGGVADADKMLVESKLLEWFWSGAEPSRRAMDGLLLECGGFHYCVFIGKRWGSWPPEGRGSASPGSGVEEAWRAPPADVL
jgi:hypothetical protein